MDFSKKFEGTNNLKKLQRDVEAKSNRAVRAHLEYVQEYLVEKMSQPGTGRTYRLPGGGTYVASAPGEYPVIKMGELINDIVVKTVSGSNQYTTIFEIGTNQPQGGILEGMFKDGMKRKDGLDAGREWLTRALRECREDLNVKLKEVFPNSEID